MVSANENFRLGVFRKVEGALEVITASGRSLPESDADLLALEAELSLDLSAGERSIVLDVARGTTHSPYAVPPKGVVDRYPNLTKRLKVMLK